MQHYSHSALYRHQRDLEDDTDNIVSDRGKLPLHPAEERASETEGPSKEYITQAILSQTINSWVGDTRIQAANLTKFSF